MTKQPRLNTPIDHKQEWVDEVFKDEEFISLVEQMSIVKADSPEEQIYLSESIKEYIKRKFAVSSADINIYKLKQIIYIENYYSKANLTFNIEKNKFSIELNEDARQKDIEIAFKQFDALRKRFFPAKETRDTTVTNIRLKRSISKARFNSKPKEIFAKLEKKELEGYVGRKNPFDTKKELTDFISRHKI